MFTLFWDFKINRDPVTAEMQRMRSQLEHLQAELLFCRSGGSALEELQVRFHMFSILNLVLFNIT